MHLVWLWAFHKALNFFGLISHNLDLPLKYSFFFRIKKLSGLKLWRISEEYSIFTFWFLTAKGRQGRRKFTGCFYPIIQLPDGLTQTWPLRAAITNRARSIIFYLFQNQRAQGWCSRKYSFCFTEPCYGKNNNFAFHLPPFHPDDNSQTTRQISLSLE